MGPPEAPKKVISKDIGGWKKMVEGWTKWVVVRVCRRTTCKATPNGHRKGDFLERLSGIGSWPLTFAGALIAVNFCELSSKWQLSNALLAVCGVCGARAFYTWKTLLVANRLVVESHEKLRKLGYYNLKCVQNEGYYLRRRWLLWISVFDVRIFKLPKICTYWQADALLWKIEVHRNPW